MPPCSPAIVATTDGDGMVRELRKGRRPAIVENQCNYHNKTERENHITISTDTEKVFDVV